jgi:5-methylcytosine-specific restriction endonuclease McrA
MPALIGDRPLTAAERTKRWREKNPERAKEVQKNYEERHPNARKEISQRFYQRNVESEKKRSIAWREKNRLKAREHQRKSWHKNRDANIARRKIWTENNKDKILEKDHRRRALELNCNRYLILPKEIKKLRNSPCNSCGSKESIQIDHVIPLSRGGSHGIGNLQPLCKSCNISKNARFMTEWYKSVGRKGNINAN